MLIGQPQTSLYPREGVRGWGVKVRVDPENAARMVEVSDDSGFEAVVQGR